MQLYRQSDRVTWRGRRSACVGRRARLNGVSLIELMFALFIMSVGVLGISGLESISLQQNRSALLRSEAVQLGNDILDRIRANPGVSSSYAPTAYGDEPSSAHNCVTSSCTAEEMAVFDVAQWKCSLYQPLDGTPKTACTALGIQGSLPGGEGSIAYTTGVYTVSVRWVDDRQGNTTSITLRAQVVEH